LFYFVLVMVEVIVDGLPVVFVTVLEEVVLAVLERHNQLLHFGHQTINVFAVASHCLQVRP